MTAGTTQADGGSGGRSARLSMLLAVLRVLGFAVGGFFVGVTIFNYLIMPGLTGHGDEVQVPDLIGRTIEQAQATLRDDGLHLGQQVQQFSSVYPDGYVVSQTPEPLTTVKPGNQVDISVSFGRGGLVIPDLSDVRYREAQVSLSRNGLRMGRISHAHSNDVGRDKIIATAPERGTLAPPGTTVDLLVSRGSAPVAFMVPDFRGRQIVEVRTFLDRSGIRLVEVPAEGDYAAPPGQVVGQRPAPGGRIRPQDVIEVDVSAAGRGRWR